MGADLILCYVAVKRNQPLDWTHVRETFSKYAADVYKGETTTLDSGEWEMFTEDLDPDEEIEVRLRELEEKVYVLIEELKDFIEGDSRDTTSFSVGEYNIYVTGGMSWGDSPSDTYDAINFLFNFPNSVWQEAGFEV